MAIKAILQRKDSNNNYEDLYPETESSQIVDLNTAIKNYLDGATFGSRKKSTSYYKNNKIRLKNLAPDLYLLCLKDGVSSDGELDNIPNSMQAGESFFDGTTEWQVKQLAESTNRHMTKLSTEWTKDNPILESGEIGIESDTHYFKVGDGNNTWESLEYISTPYLDEKLNKDATAKQAVADSKGNDINSTYIKSLSISDDILTYTKGNDIQKTLKIPQTEIENQFTDEYKNKLDRISADAEENQNAFSFVQIGADTISANTKTDTFTFTAGKNIDIIPSTLNKKITISLTGTVENADLATKAEQDGQGQQIDSTYIRDLTVNENNITITKGNNLQNIVSVNSVPKAKYDTLGQQIDSTYIKSVSSDGSGNLSVNKGNGSSTLIKVSSISQVYPIGSIYMSTMPTDPFDLFGFGVWESIPSGVILLNKDLSESESSTYDSQSTDDEATYNFVVYMWQRTS